MLYAFWFVRGASMTYIYQVHRALHGRDRHQLHSEESSEMQQLPTVLSLGHIVLYSQKSLSLSPLMKTKQSQTRSASYILGVEDKHSTLSPPTT